MDTFTILSECLARFAVLHVTARTPPDSLKLILNGVREVLSTFDRSRHTQKQKRKPKTTCRHEEIQKLVGWGLSKNVDF